MSCWIGYGFWVLIGSLHGYKWKKIQILCLYGYIWFDTFALPEIDENQFSSKTEIPFDFNAWIDLGNSQCEEHYPKFEPKQP